MRMLNAAEYDSVSGGGDLVYDARKREDENNKTKTESGALTTVSVIGSRFSFGAGAGRLIPYIGTAFTVGTAALWVWDNVIDALGHGIDEREKEAKYDESQLEEVVVEGHKQYQIKGSPSGNFWLDCDGDGQLDTQYKYDGTRLMMDITGNGTWVYVPDRPDWRRGFGP